MIAFRASSLAGVASVLLACTTSSSPSSPPDAAAPSAGGSLSGDAIWVVAQGHGFDFSGNATYIALTDSSGACGFEEKGCCPGGERLVLALASTDAAGAPTSGLETGTYVITGSATTPNANLAEAYYESGCLKQGASSGVTGTVTITRSDASPTGTIEGTFDVSLSCAHFSSCADAGEVPLSGTFEAHGCTSLDVNVTRSQCP